MSKYAQGDTFWQAMQNLSETLKEWTPSVTTEESEINARLRMYQMTGINKIEIFVEKDGKRFAVRCANTRSFIKAGSEREALMKYVEAKAKTSKINPGCDI
jgi:predicted RNase H-like HicB family nuclease